jgi:hypothetical protein
METGRPESSAARLTALFKSCVQAWGYISPARSFEQDFAIQQTKFDIEKTLFLQWARSVGILTADGEEQRLDARLTDENSDLVRTILKALRSLEILFTDFEELEAKYGVTYYDQYAGEDEVQCERISRNLMRTFSGWQQRNETHQNDPNTWERTLWACRDRDKFAAFVNEIGYFVTKLQALTPFGNYLQQLMVRHIIDAAHTDLAGLRLIRDASRSWHSNLSGAASDRITMSEASVADGDTTVPDMDGEFEPIHEWQHNLSGTIISSSVSELISIDEVLLDPIREAIQYCDEMPGILEGCWYDRVVNYARSPIFIFVKSGLRLHLRVLMQMQLEPQKYELLEMHLTNWVHQYQYVKRSAERLAKAAKPINYATLIRKGTDYAANAELEDLRSEFKGLVSSLKYMIKEIT